MAFSYSGPAEGLEPARQAYLAQQAEKERLKQQAKANQRVTNAGDTSAGGGTALITKPAYEAQEQTRLESELALKALQEKARLNSSAFKQRLSAITRMSSGMGSGTFDPGNITANEEAARNAAFARAKDRAGKTALSSLTALQNILQNRGMFGSTEEARLTQDSLQGGQDVINEYGRSELVNDLNRAAQIGDRNYAGALTQRGQDMQAKQSLLSLINSAGLY